MLGSLKQRLKATVLGAAGGRIVTKGPATARRLALTFDDGPNELTVAYLDVLDRYGAAATFFVMGDLSERNPDLVSEYLRRGHQVAIHGYDHQRFPELSWRALAHQLSRTAAAIGPQLTGRPWVRPPYGAINPRVLAQLLTGGFTVALWSVDSEDYEIKDAAALVEKCHPNALSPGDVLLFHEGQAWTLEALPPLLDNLVGAGYELVTMADLVAA